MPQTFTFFTINRDPLGANNLRLTGTGTATNVDDDPVLGPNTSDTGPQFQIGGVDFTSTAWPTYSSTGIGMEVYSATFNGQPVTFGYLTAAGDGVDDAVDRIVILSGDVSMPGRLRNVDFSSGNSTIDYNDIPSIICFTPGTFISTPTGSVLVQDLRVGDLVITAGNGIQPIRWVGRKRMTGARLMAYPHLRPIRIRKDAFGDGVPVADMWVSPQHRMLLSAERTLVDYGEKEVLAPAKGLLNDFSVTVDYEIKQTEYIHTLFDQHEVVFANGARTESFHPGQALMSAVEEDSRNELFEIFPELEGRPQVYGPSARLALRVREAMVLQRQGVALRN